MRLGSKAAILRGKIEGSSQAVITIRSKVRTADIRSTRSERPFPTTL